LRSAKAQFNLEPAPSGLIQQHPPQLKEARRNMKKIRPLHDRILVKREEEGEEKIGGIIIPDTAKEKPQRAKVVAVGAGKMDDSGKRIPLDVKSGDRILFGKYSGNEVKIDGDDYLILREEDVLAILE
jgi:chaperonin GroES